MPKNLNIPNGWICVWSVDAYLKNKKMFQVAGSFLSHRNVFWFLMMMKKFFWNINSFLIKFHSESEEDNEKGNVSSGWKLS